MLFRRRKFVAVVLLLSAAWLAFSLLAGSASPGRPSRDGQPMRARNDDGRGNRMKAGNDGTRRGAKPGQEEAYEYEREEEEVDAPKKIVTANNVGKTVPLPHVKIHHRILPGEEEDDVVPLNRNVDGALRFEGQGHVEGHHHGAEGLAEGQVKNAVAMRKGRRYNVPNQGQGQPNQGQGQLNQGQGQLDQGQMPADNSQDDLGEIEVERRLIRGGLQNFTEKKTAVQRRRWGARPPAEGAPSVEERQRWAEDRPAFERRFDRRFGDQAAAVEINLDQVVPLKTFARRGAVTAASGAGSVGGGVVSGGGAVENHTHNEGVSKKISLRRNLPDVRDRACAEMSYDGQQLPAASVVVVFCNEAWTTLLRTVHSVIDRSPPHLLKEIVLVDDFSDIDTLKQPLDDYLAMLPKVRLIRSDHRQGVAKSRQVGADSALGQVLVFLDSHCECTTGWLEPLLSRVAENPLYVVTPVMDVIDAETFDFKAFDSKSINVGGFDWGLQFTWIGIPESERKRRSNAIEPIRTPTMSGGMFAIDRQRFRTLGGFDVEMDQWGAENLELSFKIWMCGGTLETLPCSHVGHLFRKRATYKFSEGEGSNPRKNLQRLAEVWMDDYKTLFYQTVGNTEGVYGDISTRRRLREDLKCQPFKWYLRNVYPDLFVPSDALAFGPIQNSEQGAADGSKFAACIDSAVGAGAHEKPLRIFPCHGQGGNQHWMLSRNGEIRREGSCFDYSGSAVVMYPCHGQKGNQHWDYKPDKTIRHVITRRCLELTQDGASLGVAQCIRSARQIWNWERSREAAAELDAMAAPGGGVAGNGQEVARDY